MEVDLTRTFVYEKGLSLPTDRLGTRRWIAARPEREATAAEVPRIQGELTIFSTASLTDAFKEMAAQIEQANPGTKLTFNFAGSPTLRTQLAQGARAFIEYVLSPAGQAILSRNGFLVAGS